MDRPQQFFIKLDELPEEAQFYYGSPVFSDFITEVSNKHGIERDLLIDLMNGAVIENFDLVNLEMNIQNNLKINKDQINQVMIDILGIMLLPIDEYLEQIDIKGELKNKSVDIQQYQKYVNRFYDALEDENFNSLGELLDLHDLLVDPEEEKGEAIDLIQNNLAHILSKGTVGAVANLNAGLIYLLFKKKEFKDEINKILLANQEKLTHQIFSLDGKTTRPTIQNWLKDFIKQHGGEMFDNIKLSQYLSNSSNVKNLDEVEKQLVRKLLMLYRNLKFFPDSMPNDTGEGWEIIPISQEEGTLPTTRAGKESKKDGFKITPLQELEILAKQYPKGSLEHRAIMEEIKKLESQKSKS